MHGVSVFFGGEMPERWYSSYEAFERDDGEKLI